MFTVKELFLHHYLLGSEFMFTVKELFSHHYLLGSEFMFTVKELCFSITTC